MKPAPFHYFAPETVEVALELAAEYGSEAKWLAGGQSLAPAMNFRLVQPAVVIDLNRLPELAYVRVNGDGALRLGAMTRQSSVERDAAVARACPLLAEAMPHVAHPQIRNRGTVGGSLVHCDPAAELPVVAVALDAVFTVRSRNGERRIAAADFFQGLFTVDMAPEELLVDITFPAFQPGSGFSFQEVARRHGDYALVGAAATIRLDEGGVCRDARLVYLNVGECPVDVKRAAAMLRGQRLTEELIVEAVHTAAAEEMEPAGDIHATVDYQRHLARVLGRRCIEQAAARSAAARAPGDHSGEGR